MKLLTKEQEQAHYNETLKGGALGGFGGLALGTLGVIGASKRYAFFRGLTLPLRAFLITSAGTFGGIIAADHWSRSFEKAQNPKDVEFHEREKQRAEEANAGKTFTERAMDFGKKERYKIVAGSWIASMVAAFSLVNRNKYLSGQQKLVQARVYAQFLTLGVLVASAAFEISDSKNETGRYETVKYVDPKDPEHKRMLTRQQEIPQGDAGDELWKDMIKAEEDRMREKEEDEKRIRKEHEKKHAKKHAKEQPKKEGKKEQHKEEKEEDQEQRSGGEADEKKEKSK
ncbi:Replication factor C, subunit RFC4 [Knufia obscura]|uniref:Replication factor C, subunit RFC4 n=2 Tax=Knufia TaxID=430999 RepID=A0AAN8EQ17_9EURO|nr:Replication factor C, subunit RFC4 [Knufia obscura]KAK5949648.1 Replication factor C, subunit RFC4 [Knufia fluminis]